jgi:serine/threonine protein kinase/tetratricopeptide (TPR) repeat protein
MGIKCPKCLTNNPDTQKFCGECATPLPSSKEIPVTKTLETPTDKLTPGITFAGRYEIIEQLGKGGMGRVYRVKDQKLDEEMALKVLKPEIAADKGMIERFKNELKLARKIAHKSICKMYDLNEEEKTPFITMEYVKGEDLKSFVRRKGRLSEEETIAIAKQVCEGLEEAHELGVIHRDLKPQNIMIDEKSNAKVMDFGIARSVEAPGITHTGMMIGTPDYISPEQAEGEEADQRSDIYALGVILYEMVTGSVPFKGDTALSVALKHKAQLPKEPRKLNLEISEKLSRLILICMEKDRERRYQAATELLADLKNIEEGFPLGTKIKPRRETFVAALIREKLFIPTLVVVALVITAVVVIWQPWSQKEAIPIPLNKPSLAVLDFENYSGSENLDKLQAGIRELLFTDLYQSRFIRVLRSDEISSILKTLNLLDKQALTSEELKKIAEEGRINHILKGGFIEAGDNLRITATLISGTTGETIDSIIEEAEGEEDIFPTIDELTKKIKASFNLTEEQIAADIDEEIGKITTRSPEALEYYSQGREFFGKLEYEKSIPLMEKAIDLDPGFAMAFRSLAITYRILGNMEKRKVYIQKAFELSDRISERERYLIQGNFYRSSEKTYDKAIEAYTRLLELYPDDTMGNTSLGLIYAGIEDQDKAIELYEANTKRKVDTFQVYLNLAVVYEDKGLYDKAREIYEDYAKNFSEFANLRRLMSNTYVSQGKYDLALNEVNRAFSLAPTDYRNNRCFGRIYHFKGDFIEAEKELRKAAANSKGRVQRASIRELSYLYLTEGKFRKSKEQIQRGFELSRQASNASWEASFHSDLCSIFLTSGEFSSALKEAERIWDYALEADDFNYHRVALWRKGLAYVGMNSIKKAQETADELKGFIEKGIYRKAIRLYHHLQGGIELKKSNYSQAIEYLKKTVSSLLAPNWTASDFNALFYNTLALAYFKAGDLESAQKEYETIISMTWGRWRWGNIYAKSFYMLGKIYEQQGNEAKAIEHYEKFLDLWKDADPGIAEVEDAKKRLAGLQSQ